MRVPELRRPHLTAEQRHHYRAFRIEQVAPFERLAAVAGAASVVVFVLWDRAVDVAAVADTLPIRLGFALVLVLLFAATLTKLGRFHTALQLTATAAVSTGFSWVLSELPNGFLIGVPGLTVMIALLPLVALSLHAMVMLCALSVAIPNLFLLGTYAAGFTFVNLNVWLAFAVALALSFWFVIDRVNRRLFLAELEVADERERADRLLANMLPPEISERLKEADATVADRFELVSVLFADIVGFTKFARTHEAGAVVDLLNELFSQFDDLVAASGLEKIKTLGDGYMLAGGVPAPDPDHAPAVANLALELVAVTARFAAENDIDWSIRIGIHAGSVVAGVIGKRKLAYDLWGDAVNVASRLESTSVAGRIQVSGDFAELLPERYVLERRGTITLKHRGAATTFFLNGAMQSQPGRTDSVGSLADGHSPEGVPVASHHPQSPTTTANTAPPT